MAERFKLGDLDNEQFYMLPKGLFTHPQYKKLTNTARIVYAMLKDRMKLSLKNGWHDENGEVYINFTQEKMALLLNITPRAVKQTMASLKNVGLISTKRQGLGLPNKIYIHKLLPLPIHGEIILIIVRLKIMILIWWQSHIISAKFLYHLLLKK